MKITKSLAAYIAAASFIAVAAPAHATVATTGCASGAGCSLSELYAGGSISVNDVTFDSFALNFDFSTLVNLDPTQMFVSGVDESVSGVLGLDFTFSPELLIPEFGAIDYDWDFNASINGGSRTIAGMDLSLTNSRVVGDAFTQVSADVFDGSANNLGLLSVFENQGGLSSPSTLSNLTALTTAMFDFDIQGEGFAAGSLAGLTTFRLLLNLNGTFTPPTTVVPLPAAFPLMLAGIIGLALAMGRRARRRSTIA